jgi:xylulokinase
VILTVDLGTSVTKVVVWDENGPVFRGRSAVESSYPGGNRAEQDPDAWWTSLAAACAAARAPGTVGTTAISGGGSDVFSGIRAIGFSAARQTFVPVTEDGTTLGAALLWSDRRAVTEAADLARRFGDRGASGARRSTGMALDSGSVAAKLAWLTCHEPERLRAARWLLAPRDLIVWRLTGFTRTMTPDGHVATDHTLASATGLYELARPESSATSQSSDGPGGTGAALGPLSDTLVGGLPEAVVELLPEPVAPGSVVGTLAEGPAAELGLPPGIPIVIGAGDRPCEVLGTGASATWPMVSWGTTANVSLPVDRWDDKTPEVLVVTRGARRGWLLEGGLAAAGSLVDWLSRLTGMDADVLGHHAASSPPGANGVIVLPWFGGARAPWWRDGARGAVVGLALDHHLGDLARAVVESVAWDVTRCLESAAPAMGSEPLEGTVLGGSGATAALWTEVLTGVTGLPARRRRSGDAAGAGAALLSAHALGWDYDLDRIDPVVTQITPDPSVVADYRARRAEVDAAAQAVIGLGGP